MHCTGFVGVNVVGQPGLCVAPQRRDRGPQLRVPRPVLVAARILDRRRRRRGGCERASRSPCCDEAWLWLWSMILQSSLETRKRCVPRASRVLNIQYRVILQKRYRFFVGSCSLEGEILDETRDGQGRDGGRLDGEVDAEMVTRSNLILSYQRTSTFLRRVAIILDACKYRIDRLRVAELTSYRSCIRSFSAYV